MIAEQRVIAVIPARGGSKGIPRKNVVPVGGKPLIAHTIEQAKRSDCLDAVIVSTDDAEIGQLAVAAGAEVIPRPAELSGDTATSESALLHVLEQLDARGEPAPDLLVFLQATSPLTATEDIDGTVRALLEAGADSALAVTPFHYFLWGVAADGSADGIGHDKAHRPRRQDRQPQYVETGAVYVMRVPGFLKARHRFFGKTAVHVTPADRHLEIDEPADLEVAEVKLRRLQRLDRLSRIPSPVDAVIFDFDGVFTDNRVSVTQTGTEAVSCNRSDGWGLARLRERGVPMLVLSTEANPVVSARCQKLRLECLQNVADKAPAMLAWLAARVLRPGHTLFVGNDDNDLGCLQAVGCGIVVADAYPRARAAADLVLEHKGGDGAVREVADLVLQMIGAAPGSQAAEAACHSALPQ